MRAVSSYEVKYLGDTGQYTMVFPEHKNGNLEHFHPLDRDKTA
jgi:hypothetical protein